MDHKTMLLLSLLFIIACTAAPSRTAAKEKMVELVSKGVPKAAILLSAHPDSDEQEAAREIVDHIKHISGAELPVLTNQLPELGIIPIRIGLTFAPAAAQEIRTGRDDPASFLLRVTDNGILLAGLSPQGARFAAYELLERLGVRWFFPGELGTVIPQTETLALPVGDIIQHPGFGGRRLQDVGDRSEAKWSRRRRAGGLDAGAHSLGPEFDRDKEPDLFMQENGHPTGQVRVSHPEVHKRVIEYWQARLAKNPPIKYMAIGPGDGAGFGQDPWDAGDMDPLHGKVSVTDRYVKFFNIVLAELQKTYPDVGIGFYCYAQYMRPPVREKPNPKILPVFAPIDVCRFHAIDNPICPERSYMKTIVGGWKALGVDMMYRGYLFNLADQGLPFSMIRQIRTEYPYYHDQGFLSCRVECKPAWSYHAPSLYLAYKIIWDPSLDVDAVLDEYFTLLYGPAAKPMQQHFKTLEQAYRQADYHTGNIYDIPHILTPAVMKDLRNTLEKAERLASKDPILARRVNMVRVGYDFGVANLEMMAAVNAFDFIKAKQQYDHLINDIVPMALAHDPQLLNMRYARSFIDQFWGDTIKTGYDIATGANEIIAKLPDQWQFLLDPLDGGEALGFYKPGMGDRNWTTLNTYSTSWSNQGLRYYKGECWYRTKIDVPAKYRGRRLRLWLGGIDDNAKAWINGTALPQLARGRAPTGQPWQFDATAAIEPGQHNVIVVKVSNRAVDELGTGGITGPAMLWAEGN